MTRPGIGQLIAGAGGALLIVSLFLPWTDAEGVSRTGWEALSTADVLLVIAGLVAILAAITGGRIGVFRPDVSLNGATDLFGVVATVLVAWYLAFELPEGATPEAGAFLALIASTAIMGGAGDYRVLRGAPVFPVLPREAPASGPESRSATPVA
jgi:formate hydrogenlyase subunit 4